MRDIQKFITLKIQLTNERDHLQQRLSEINRALGDTDDVTRSVSPETAQRRKRTPKRIKNPMSLRAAVTEVTKAKALSKPDILKAVGKLGYKFSASDPVNSLNTILYSKPKFKNQNGKFSAA